MVLNACGFGRAFTQRCHSLSSLHDTCSIDVVWSRLRLPIGVSGQWPRLMPATGGVLGMVLVSSPPAVSMESVLILLEEKRNGFAPLTLKVMIRAELPMRI